MKGVECVNGDCVGEYGEAVLSEDGTKIYALIYYDIRFLFYTLSVVTGEALSTCYRYADLASSASDGAIDESNGRVYIFLKFSDPIFLIFNTTTDKFDYTFVADGTDIKYFNIAATKNDLMLMVAQRIDDTMTTILRNFYSNFFSIYLVQNSTFAMDAISSSDYAIVDRSIGGVLSFSSVSSSTFDLFYPVTYYSITRGAEQDFFMPSIWNLDHYEPHLLPNKRYEIDFTWT
jgi:hypothetical protein